MNEYDSSADYFAGDNLDDVILINVPAIESSTSQASTISNDSHQLLTSPKQPPFKRPRLNPPQDKVDQQELNNLKRDNLVKAGRLLDLQIQATETDIELKHVSLELERAKLRMYLE